MIGAGNGGLLTGPITQTLNPEPQEPSGPHTDHGVGRCRTTLAWQVLCNFFGAFCFLTEVGMKGGAASSQTLNPCGHQTRRHGWTMQALWGFEMRP